MEHLDRNSEQEKYERAKKQVENEKAWYSHLTVYIIVNITLQFFYAGFVDDGRITDHMPWWVRLTTPTIWGLSLIIHWFYVFKAVRLTKFYKNWEDRKIKEFMEEEEEEFIQTIRKK